LRKTQKGVERMDYWEYLAHGQGSERRGHRYYARELIGNKNGKNVYRYFYTADEYSAYKQNKGTPGRGTYAETGTSRSAIVWPKNTSRKRKAAEARNSVEQQKSAMDRERTRTSVRAEKIKMDAKAYRKQRRQEKNDARHELKRKMDVARKRKLARESVAAQKSAMDRDRAHTSVLAEKVQMDAKRYRKQKRERIKANRIAQQHTMDRERWKKNEKAEQAKSRGDKHSTRVQEAIREKVHKDAVAYRRKRAQESVRAQKVAMDAKRYRRQKREMLKQKRAGQKRIMDNIRQRPYYQPTIKRGR